MIGCSAREAGSQVAPIVLAAKNASGGERQATSSLEADLRIGILGSGLMGGKLGTLCARAGHDVVFSYSHDQKKLERLARDAGANARAGTPEDAARGTDALLLAVHWSRVDQVLAQAGDL